MTRAASTRGRHPRTFLPWLASWVALDFPTLQGEPLWDEYQRRKVTSQIAQVYRQRGLKSGLASYLDLYAVGPAGPGWRWTTAAGCWSPLPGRRAGAGDRAGHPGTGGLRGGPGAPKG